MNLIGSPERHAVMIEEKVEETTVSETRQPNPISWVDHWERGLDPWHADAFIGTPAEGVYVCEEVRKAGWYAIDWCGNVVGFIPEGTPIVKA